jgi:Ni/Co efflux regulator RcnB
MGGPHPAGPPAAMVRPGGPPPGAARFSYRGAALPPLFFARDYWYADWAGLGLDPPPPGYQWVRYGPDLLLVNVITGQVADVAYGVFYD